MGCEILKNHPNLQSKKNCFQSHFLVCLLGLRLDFGIYLVFIVEMFPFLRQRSNSVKNTDYYLHLKKKLLFLLTNADFISMEFCNSKQKKNTFLEKLINNV